MSIVSLESRTTSNWGEYEAYRSSSDSLIFINGTFTTDASGPDCLCITVGNCWYDNGKYIELDKTRGLHVRPHTSIVFEASEQLALPLNIYGLLFGTGSNIYRGAFISSGKVDPGFSGKLKIGFHNGSDESILLHIGDKLAYCLFLNAESCLINMPFSTPVTPPVQFLTKREKLKKWFFRNASQIITIAIALLSFLFSFFK